MGFISLVACAIVLAALVTPRVSAYYCQGCIYPAISDPINNNLPDCVHTTGYSSVWDLPYCNASSIPSIDCGSNYPNFGNGPILLGPYCATFYSRNGVDPIVKACGTISSSQCSLRSNGFTQCTCGSGDNCTPPTP